MALTDKEIRASWLAVYEEMRKDLLEGEPYPFNPNSVDRALHNFIETMVFAKLPCGRTKGIAAAWQEFRLRPGLE